MINGFDCVVGITAFTQKGHIARATLEATCFQTKAILDAMEKDSGTALAELAVDGGMTNSDLCMQVNTVLSILLTNSSSCTTVSQGALWLENTNEIADPKRPDRNPCLATTYARDYSARRRDRCWFCCWRMEYFRRVEKCKHSWSNDFPTEDWQRREGKEVCKVGESG